MLILSKDGEEGAKARYIGRFLNYFSNAGIKPLITLSDKDWSEINACQAIFPDSKHQLCFWHALRAVKTRLSILRRGPAFYHADDAHSAFSFIDAAWIPEGQMLATEPVSIIHAIFLDSVLRC